MLIKFPATLPNPNQPCLEDDYKAFTNRHLPAGLASSVQLVSNRRKKKNERGIRKSVSSLVCKDKIKAAKH